MNPSFRLPKIKYVDARDFLTFINPPQAAREGAQEVFCPLR